jgi:hypothetical protein
MADVNMFDVPSEDTYKEKKVGTNIISASEGVLTHEVCGMYLMPDEGTYADVFDYLFRLVFRHNISIKDMLMEDSCALEPSDMKYFDKRMFGKVPSYAYWRGAYMTLPAQVREDLELTEQELLQSKYLNEMTGMAKFGEGSAQEGRLFSYWKRLHDISMRKEDRVVRRKEKREAATLGFNDGVNKTLEIIKKIKDGDLLEIKKVIEGVANEKKAVE